MSSSSSSVYHDAAAVPHCLCRVPRVAVRRTSWSERNPGRRFYNCPLSLMPGDCKFFDWCDPPLNTHYKELILRLRNEADGNALAEAEQKLEAAESRLARLKAKFAKLKEQSNLEVGRLKAQYAALNLRAKVVAAYCAFNLPTSRLDCSFSLANLAFNLASRDSAASSMCSWLLLSIPIFDVEL
ncbi:hypothetical protein LXL04_014753 [Taraxacum kok-saghyz]